MSGVRWCKRITSGGDKYPTVKDVLTFLLIGLMEEKVASSWVHFEIVSKSGWFSNLLSGGQPFLEVGYSEDFLELNCGLHKLQHSMMPRIPEKWQKRKKQWLVPHEDANELIQWMDNCLSVAANRANFRVSGWIEG